MWSDLLDGTVGDSTAYRHVCCVFLVISVELLRTFIACIAIGCFTDSMYALACVFVASLLVYKSYGWKPRRHPLGNPTQVYLVYLAVALSCQAYTALHSNRIINRDKNNWAKLKLLKQTGTV